MIIISQYYENASIISMGMGVYSLAIALMTTRRPIVRIIPFGTRQVKFVIKGRGASSQNIVFIISNR